VDPVANLNEQRSLAEKILEREDHEPNAEFATNQALDAARLAELVQALDEWRKDGGFDPYVSAEDVIEKVYDAYKPKMAAVLMRVRDTCNAAGLLAEEPFDMSGDDYKWSMRVWRSQAARDEGDDDNCVDVSVEIAESREYDGENDYGINFGIDIVEWGGRILGGLTPFNYTAECWVDARDDDAVSDRWQIIEDADPGEIPPLIREER
jgi:hypothetical protein